MDSRYKKMSNEKKEDYIWRMCSNKSYHIYKLSWKQLGKILNTELNENFTSSKWRKNYQNEKRGYDRAIVKNSNIQSEINELELAKDELYKAQVKNRDKLREIRNTLKNTARFENLQDTAIRCANIMSKSYPFKIITNIKNEKNTKNEKLAVLLLSDFHYGITIKNFLNNFDKTICQERIKQVIEETIKTCQINKVNDLKILNLGDLINGFLHLSARVENEEDVITQVMEVSELLANIIKQLAPYFNSIQYIDVLDNHSRCNANKKLSLENENFGRLVAWYLNPRLSGLKNVEIINKRLDETLVQFDILGEKCFAVHGHLDKVSSVVSKLSLLIKQVPMAIFMAHIHHNYEDDDSGVDIIVNGTLSGTDTYAKELRLNSKPMQKLLIYKKINGRVKRDITKYIEF